LSEIKLGFRLKFNLMKNNSKYIFVSILVFMAFCKVQSQYSELGICLGLSTYWGDLNRPSIINNYVYNSGLAIQGSYRYMQGHYLGVRVAGTFGRLRGADFRSDVDWQRVRNLDFKSHLLELAVTGEFYPFGFNTTPGARFWAPYITAGVAVFNFDPKTVYRGNEIRLQPLGTEGQGLPEYPNKYKLTQFSIPFGGGIKFILTEKISMGIEVAMRTTFTDYIDDVSTIYINYDEHSEAKGTSLPAQLANRMNEFLGQEEPVRLATGSQRGGASVNDFYFVTMFNLSFMITDHSGKKRMGSNQVICPTF